jgi:subtilase family serine protease
VQGSGPYTPSQIRTAYSLTGNFQTASGSAIVGDGSGQTIGIVDANYDPNVLNDLKTFDAQFGLPNTDASGQSVLTQATYGSTTNAGWGLETDLDVEWAHAIAPKAHILLVEAASSSNANLLTAVNYARSRGAGVISMSWGSNEFNGETSYDSYFNHAGVSYVASAGDTGGVAEWPAEAPDVVSVGGTYVTTDTTTGARYSESAWGTSAANVGGSGGGVSAYEPKPFYQGGVTLSSSRRTSPDVSYNADPNSGFYVYDGNYNGQAGWFNVGGTSAGAPQWAGLIAIADQLRASVGKSRLDTASSNASNLLNTIYHGLSKTSTLSSTSSDLYDVQSGTAGSHASTTGYDLATGNGSPFADRLIVDLANA